VSRQGGSEVALGRLQAPPPAEALHHPGVDARWPAQILDGPAWTVLRMLVDALAMTLGVVFAALTAEEATGSSLLGVLPFAVLLAIAARGLYGQRVRTLALDELPSLAGAISAAAMCVVAAQELAYSQPASSLVVTAWALTLVMVLGSRVVLGRAHQRARLTGAVAKPTVIVGSGLVGTQVAMRLGGRPEYGLRPVGFLDPGGEDAPNHTSLPVLGTPGDLAYVVTRMKVRHVIFAFTTDSDEDLLPLLRQCEALGVEVSVVPRFFESTTDRITMERIGSLPLLAIRSVDPKGWLFRIKYALDRVAAAVMLVTLAPVMLVVAAAVKLSSPGPVLFPQRRVGRDGQAFDLYKFRSMRAGQHQDPVAIALLRPGVAPGGVEGEDRRTGVGRFLRRFSIDELPQLLNVVRGEMSLIGPRPERPEFVALFAEDMRRYDDRHRVKSGITGWAQVHGLRGQTSLADRVEWDNFYIENWSPWLDAKVLLLTVGAIFRSNGDA
jgi:exopolysaccharide biosynthesis polyprenyl glycosylphosphotransferase